MLALEQIRWIAHLARLKLTDAELETMGRQLNGILDFVDQLQQVNTTDVEPLAHPLPVQNVFGADEPAPSLSVEKALANAPKRLGDFYEVPAVFD